jgi:hypothetical protein
MKYENRADIPDSTIGKIVLCEVGDTMALYANMQRNPTLERCSEEMAKKYFYQVLALDDERIGRILGYHSGIRHQGRILVGALLMKHQGKMYIAGESQMYKGRNDDAIFECLKDFPVERID